MEQELNKIEGKIDDIIFRNDSNGYTVASLVTDDLEEITITGIFPTIELGDRFELEGEKVFHPSYGPQFRVTSYVTKEPATKEAILAFLSSGVLDGIGRTMAERIFDKFGLDAIRVLDDTPEKLLEIEGIGKKKCQKIIESYKDKRDLKVAILHFSGYGLTPAMAMKIYRYYGEKAKEIVEDNPYCLCRDIKGIGFRKADEIAERMGIAKNDIHRIMEGVVYLLQEAGMQGHVYLPADVVREQAAKLLGVSTEEVQSGIYELCISSKTILERSADESERLYLPLYRETESNVANLLSQLLVKEELDVGVEADTLIQEIQDKTGICLADKQKAAVTTALNEKIMIVTGGPGTGKTTVVKFILKCFEKQEKKVVLCAPTGRAAKRLTEASNQDAKTIHRLLEVGFSEDDEEMNYYNRDEQNPLESDVIIVDEMSMVDMFLMRALLRAIPKHARLIMIGDADQLPSVGAGNVLWDMIESNLIPVVRLTEIFRQEEESQIIQNAHRVNHGQELIIDKESKDFFFMMRRDGDKVKDLILELIKERLPNYFGVESTEIQILTPVRKGGIGMHEINQKVQETLNPPSEERAEFKYMNTVFRENDKVMQIKNNYEKKYRNTVTYEEGEGVFNGDIGVIDTVDVRGKQFYITFDDNRRCRYEFAEVDNIEHAYAITVHKSQGSEFDVVILPILSLPPMLQNRNILYTAITRAKKGLVLVGNMYYVNRMIQNMDRQERYSSLAERLKFMKEHYFEDEVSKERTSETKQI